MIINITCIFFLLVGIYFGIITYIETRKRIILLVLGIFLGTLILEISRLNTASYELDTNDFLRTSRDIIRILIMIFFFQCMREHFPYNKTSSAVPEKKIVKKLKKKSKKK